MAILADTTLTTENKKDIDELINIDSVPRKFSGVQVICKRPIYTEIAEQELQGQKTTVFDVLRFITINVICAYERMFKLDVQADFAVVIPKIFHSVVYSVEQVRSTGHCHIFIYFNEDYDFEEELSKLNEFRKKKNQVPITTPAAYVRRILNSNTCDIFKKEIHKKNLKIDIKQRDHSILKYILKSPVCVGAYLENPRKLCLEKKSDRTSQEDVKNIFDVLINSQQGTSMTLEQVDEFIFKYREEATDDKKVGKSGVKIYLHEVSRAKKIKKKRPQKSLIKLYIDQTEQFPPS